MSAYGKGTWSLSLELRNDVKKHSRRMRLEMKYYAEFSLPAFYPWSLNADENPFNCSKEKNSPCRPPSRFRLLKPDEGSFFPLRDELEDKKNHCCKSFFSRPTAACVRLLTSNANLWTIFYHKTYPSKPNLFEADSQMYFNFHNSLMFKQKMEFLMFPASSDLFSLLLNEMSFLNTQHYVKSTSGAEHMIFGEPAGTFDDNKKIRTSEVIRMIMC